MITIIDGSNRIESASLLSDMFRLRARVFHGELGWDVIVNADGEERDKFDDMLPVYIVASDGGGSGKVIGASDGGGGGKVIGAMRLLPTTGQVLSEECFADTLPDGAKFESPTIWECSRTCANSAIVLLDMIKALGKLAEKVGIETVICNLEEPTLRLYRQIGLKADVLGHTDRYGHRVYLAMFSVAESRLTFRERRGMSTTAQAATEGL